MKDDDIWIPAVPVPLTTLLSDICGGCGTKFKGRDRRKRYTIHYRREHHGSLYPTASDTTMRVSRVEADRIYAEVWGND